MSDTKQTPVTTPLDNHATDVEDTTTADPSDAESTTSTSTSTQAKGTTDGTASPLDNHATDEKA